jgi:hypothetical protein
MNVEDKIEKKIDEVEQYGRAKRRKERERGRATEET